MNRRIYLAVRACVRTVNSPVAKMRMRRAFARAPRPMRLEIGGLHPREGWIVTNVNATTPLYLNATKPWPIEDDSIEYVYCDNMIEHVPLAGARVMLSEAARCLRPGGAIRLVTPDIRSHVEMYLSGIAPLDRVEGRHYADAGMVVEHPIDMVRIPIGSFGHHEGYVYDPETLQAELRRAGFSSTTEAELGTSEHPPLSGLDLRGGEGGAQMAIEGVV